MPRHIAELGRYAAGVRKAVTFALAAAVCLVSCSSAGRNAVQITNLKQGLMRPIKDGGWEVYEEGSRFDVVENGKCIADSLPISCMWFGIAFDYTGSSSTTTLKCSWTSSEPIVSVTPNKVLGRVTALNVDLVLEGRSGHEARPGYAEVPWPGGERRLKYECQQQRAVVLSVEFELEGRGNGAADGA